MPRVMVEGFLRDHLDIDHVVGREIKEFYWYFVGVMEEKKDSLVDLAKALGEESLNSNIIGICDSKSSLGHPFFSTYKISMQTEPSSNRCHLYVGPIRSHLGGHPDLSGLLRTSRGGLPNACFFWTEISCFRAQARQHTSTSRNKGVITKNQRAAACLQPENPSRFTFPPNSTPQESHNSLIQCKPNHGDPNTDEVSPINEGSRTRCRDYGDIVKRREPCNMPSGGLKSFDPIFCLMDPHPSYTIRLLGKVKGLSTCQDDIGQLKFVVANRIQSEMGEALGFECTRLTRRHKYLILAGNDGTVSHR
ncbi:hypothetical protein Ancab_022520 [Ancistrocladus abbreviatus]